MKRIKFPGSLCKGQTVGKAEQYLGHFVGPLGYGFLSILINSYLNVYYTDVCGLGSLWGGTFMSVYPILVKCLDVITYITAGWFIDRTVTREGKARPYVLISAILLPASAVFLFLVPEGSDFLASAAVLGSNVFFFAIVATLYSTATTLIIPLSSSNESERSRLAVTTNAQALVTGTAVVIFPSLILPQIGVDQSRWIIVILTIAMIAVPLLVLQYLFTRERVTEREQAPEEKLSLIRQLRCCGKSRKWVVLMVYFLVLGFVNALSSSATFYYCNWVLGSYNDGFTQVLFYAIGNMPMGIGVFLCNPICRKLGRTRAMTGGLALACVGLGMCFIFPRSLPIVLAGQFIKACGMIPSTYLASVLLSEALDSVQERSGVRCDGFTSSLYNSILTLTNGVAISLLNAGMAVLGYLAPSAGAVAAQPQAVQSFFVFCQMGAPLLAYPALGMMLRKIDRTGRKNAVKNAAGEEQFKGTQNRSDRVAGTGKNPVMGRMVSH